MPKVRRIGAVPTGRPHAGNDPMTAGFDTARANVPGTVQERQRLEERRQQACLKLAVIALERYPGDEPGASRWLAEMLDLLGLRLVVNPKRASGFCPRCGGARRLSALVYADGCCRECALDTDDPRSPARIRAWARKKGFRVPERGPLPDELIDRYRSEQAVIGG